MKFGLGTMKGKIIAGVVAVGVITGSGIAFANSDAGDQLRAWYDAMFNQSVENIEDEVQAYGESKIPELTEEYEGMKEEAGIEIDLTRELETGKSLEEIIEAKMDHLESLDAEKQEILANITQDFYGVYLDGYFQILDIQGQALEYATNDLGEFTSDAGQAAVDQMTTDINAARDEAVMELEEAIEQTQEELAAAIDTHEEMTTNNLISQVDWAIEDLREQVTELLDGLVEEQQTIIADTAQQLEDAAIDALDDVVSGINQ